MSASPTTNTAQIGTDWGTIAEAAKRRQVSADTIRRMIARGEIVAERFGARLIRVDLNSVETAGRKIGGTR